MKKKYFILSIIAIVFLFLLSSELEIYSKLSYYYNFFEYIIIFFGFSLLPFLLLLNIFKEDIIRSLIFTFVFSFIFTFAIHYKKMDNLKAQNERLRSNYEEAIKNVIDLVEEKNLFVDEFIEVFPEYYDYLD